MNNTRRKKQEDEEEQEQERGELKKTNKGEVEDNLRKRKYVNQSQ